MRNFKDKTQVFFLGLMLGLLVGVGFFILKLDNYFQELNFYKNLSQHSQHLRDSTEMVNIEKPVKKKQRSQNQKKESVQTTDQDTTFPHNTGNDELNNLVYKKMLTIDMMENDTVPKDTLGLIQADAPEDIVVKKDELLAVRVFDLESKPPTMITKNPKDSLLQQVSGINGDNSKVAYKIEFWKSPINYKGYKMTKNKILLYGINPGDIIKLSQLDENIYLKHLINTYKLDFTNDFKQLEKVSDETILTKLKL